MAVTHAACAASPSARARLVGSLRAPVPSSARCDVCGGEGTKLKVDTSNTGSFVASQTEFEGSRLQCLLPLKWIPHSPSPSLPSEHLCLFGLSLDGSLSISKGYGKIEYMNKGGMAEAGVRKADINTDDSRRVGGRR